MAAQLPRTDNIVKNVATVVLTKSITLLLSFVSRTIFIRLLGKEYLGIDGLFTSILNIFSLAELGIGSALIFSMYAPIAQGDYKRSRQFLTLYKKAYQYIFLIILGVGLMLLPFIKKIVNADLDALGINIYIVYILFLFRTLSSYFLAHKQAVLVVNQQQRTVSIYQTIVLICVYVLECVTLLLFNNYYLFLIIGLAGNYGTALVISYVANKRFPVLCVEEKEKLPKFDIDRIKKNVAALFLRRVGGVVYSSTNNIVINAYISLAVVGIYSNYLLIVNSIQTITNQAMSAMTASIGNFVSTNTKADTESAFNLYTFITYLIYGFCSVCFMLITNSFVDVLWGTEYVLSKTALFLIVLNFMLYGFQSAINVFRDTTGLFVQGKYRGFVSAIVNVIVSIVFVQIWGLEGVLFGTIVARLLVSAWYDPFVIYKHFFEKNPLRYFKRLIIYILVPFGMAFLFGFLLSHFTQWENSLIVNTVLSILSLPFLIIPFAWTKEYKDLKIRLIDFIRFRRK